MSKFERVRPHASMRVFVARQIHTMDESLPHATAVGVIDGRIAAVGDLDSMEPWREGREIVIDESLRDKVLMPGFIDNHVHPFLGALLTPMEIIAPEAWRLGDGGIAPAANTPERYLELLMARLEARTDRSELFISFGYQQSEHGRLRRAELDRLCPDRPVILWQRSFHETFLNTAAIERLGLTKEAVGSHPQVNLAEGHFFETGNKLVVAKLLPVFLRPQWYRRGLDITAELMHQGGITTAGDMLFGAIDPEYELAALEACIEQKNRPLRVVNIADARGFANRAVGRTVMGTPDECPPFEAGLKTIESMLSHQSQHVRFSKAVKLFADGAMFSQLMQMNFPGYMDGHEGEWLMSPKVLTEGVRVFWDAGYQIHVHVNGDRGMDAVLTALELAQLSKPRFDHRFIVHHVGFHTNAQSRRLGALGAHASVNPYYIYALADSYSQRGIGPERAAQLVRAGSLVRNGLRVSFHSDFMMAPMEPLLLAWCAATRTTKSGHQVAPEERLTLEQALRGVTIDAAFALHLDDEIGSIVAGKRADFTVLEDDPFILGVERLKDVRVAGTVFDGQVHLLAHPTSSIFAGDQTVGRATGNRASAKSHSHGAAGYTACCGADGDPCMFLRQLASFGPTVMTRGLDTSQRFGQ
jgi:predicted amidohydrolase YtcJ